MAQAKPMTVKKKFNETVKNMESLGVYKPEFRDTIQRYAELSLDYERTKQEWIAGGCKITEAYTNKAGATNERKTALYQVLENLRKELLDMEGVLGLTPKGLKALQKELTTEDKSDNKMIGLAQLLGNTI